MEILNSIVRRYNQCEYFTNYYIKHSDYPPLSFCQKINNFMFGKNNQNAFHFFMTFEKRKNYKFPYLFAVGKVVDRKNLDGINLVLSSFYGK